MPHDAVYESSEWCIACFCHFTVCCYFSNQSPVALRIKSKMTIPGFLIPLDHSCLKINEKAFRYRRLFYKKLWSLQVSLCIRIRNSFRVPALIASWRTSTRTKSLTSLEFITNVFWDARGCHSYFLVLSFRSWREISILFRLLTPNFVTSDSLLQQLQ